MVALEALKSSVNYLTVDIGKLDQIIASQYKKISSNQEDIVTSMQLLSDTYKNIVSQTKYLQESCAYAQRDLTENKYALILYC